MPPFTQWSLFMFIYALSTFLTSTASVSTETILEFEAIRKMQNSGDEFFQDWC